MSGNDRATSDQQAPADALTYNCCWCPHTETDGDAHAAAARMTSHYETTHAAHLAASRTAAIATTGQAHCPAPTHRQKPGRAGHRFKMPSEWRRHLEATLPRKHGAAPVVRVTPRDTANRRCAAWSADHYEVQAYYTTTDRASLDALEDALRQVPGVYLTTQIRGHGRVNEVTNPAWPIAAGAARRGFHDLRPQVLAHIHP
ncbi:hypothetical protein [Actinomadura sp. 3N407]|uniref:hypothetical protein n=1 Tax=Actinomadura sp. 3N407 TaxID=3457423 RepID=UPI003FCD7BAF